MDASQSFQLPEKAAEANYVPAMSSLSVAYAEQKTPVCGERATYWAMKAADADDPRGRLVLGFEYNTGNCIAMMASGELYSHGMAFPPTTLRFRAGKRAAWFRTGLWTASLENNA